MVLVTYTAEDYREAEKVFLAQSGYYRFRGVSLERLCDERRPAIEAAIIDILLSYDNEGGRIVLIGKASDRERTLRKRLHHIRKHTDPGFIGAELKRLEHIIKGPGFAPFIPNARRAYDGTAPHDSEEAFWDDKINNYMKTLEDALKNLSALQTKHPGLQELPWNSKRGFENMLKEAGVESEPIMGAAIEDVIDSSMLSSITEDYEEMNLLPLHLLRETQLDEHGLSVLLRLDMASYEFAESWKERFPRIAHMVKNYEARLKTMRAEQAEIESRLSAMDTVTTTKGDRELRNSEEFGKVSAISLLVLGLDFLELVRKIIKARYGIHDDEPDIRQRTEPREDQDIQPAAY